MDSKSMTIIKIIFLLFSIGYALVDDSNAMSKSTQPASPPIYLHNHLSAEKTKKILSDDDGPYTNTPAGPEASCYKNVHASDKTHIAKLLCEDNSVPIRRPASYDCCIRLWHIDENCYNVLIEDLKKQYPCDNNKDRCDIRDRARQIWKFCRRQL
ncbi:hypothetical protein OROGR_022680 [Orobanche gracilis]